MAPVIHIILANQTTIIKLQNILHVLATSSPIAVLPTIFPCNTLLLAQLLIKEYISHPFQNKVLPILKEVVE
jgi:hypothetical protein